MNVSSIILFAVIKLIINYNPIANLFFFFLKKKNNYINIFIYLFISFRFIFIFISTYNTVLLSIYY